MCSFGALLDLVYRIGYQITKRRFRIPKHLDVIFRYAKYVILAVLIVMALMDVAVAKFSPWDAFGMVFTVGSVPNFPLLIRILLPGVILLLLILAASLFIERFFCRYLCPIGAVFAASSAGRLARIEKRRDKCGKCQICTRSCPMGIDLSSMEVVKSVECIDCMRCIEACPRNNSRLIVARTKVPEKLVVMLAILLISTSYLTLSIINEKSQMAEDAAWASDGAHIETEASAAMESSIQTTTNTQGMSESIKDEMESTVGIPSPEVSPSPTPTISDSSMQGISYLDGVYQGSGEGFRGEVIVEVTILEGKIQDIVTISYSDDDKYFERASRIILSEVVDTQSAEVDAVSGATYSSEGLLQAIRDALSKAEASS